MKLRRKMIYKQSKGASDLSLYFEALKQIKKYNKVFDEACEKLLKLILLNI